jgi:hypothetical protein
MSSYLRLDTSVDTVDTSVDTERMCVEGDRIVVRELQAYNITTSRKLRTTLPTAEYHQPEPVPYVEGSEDCLEPSVPLRVEAETTEYD